MSDSELEESVYKHLDQYVTAHVCHCKPHVRKRILMNLIKQLALKYSIEYADTKED